MFVNHSFARTTKCAIIFQKSKQDIQIYTRYTIPVKSISPPLLDARHVTPKQYQVTSGFIGSKQLNIQTKLDTHAAFVYQHDMRIETCVCKWN